MTDGAFVGDSGKIADRAVAKDARASPIFD